MTNTAQKIPAHTPGPWEARFGRSGYAAIYVAGTDHDVAVGVKPANAGLIAAAPKMYAALREIASDSRKYGAAACWVAGAALADAVQS